MLELVSILSKNKKVSQNCSCQLSYLLLTATVRLPRLEDTHGQHISVLDILSQLLCRTSQVAWLLSSKNYSRRDHIGIYVGIQEILSSKSNTSSSINRSEHPAAGRRVKSTPTSSFKSGDKKLLRRGTIGWNHQSPGSTLKSFFNERRRVHTMCENIHSWISLVGDLVFSHQGEIYGFKFPKRFLEISFRDLTLSFLCQS